MPTTFLQLFQLLGLATVFGALISAIVSHFLQVQRDREARLFDARREVYAEVMKTVNYEYLTDGGVRNSISDPDFGTKLRIQVGQCFSRARMLASKPLSDKLRELFEAEVALMAPEPGDPKDPKLSDKRAKLVNEVEQLMRKDLGVFR